jgi:hypothetical protein
MAKRYYTLLAREPNRMWSPQFGDYDRAVVAAQADTMKASGTWLAGTKLKIIDTLPPQSEIDAAVAELNASIALRQIKDANVVEDRLEYDVEMLAQMYGLKNDAATRLHHLLHTYK